MSSTSQVRYAALVLAVMHELRDVRAIVAKHVPELSAAGPRGAAIADAELEAAGATLRGVYDRLRRIEAESVQVQSPPLE